MSIFPIEPIAPPLILPHVPSQVCLTSFIPTYNSVHVAFQGIMAFPPTTFIIPPLPSVPNPLFSDLSIINVEAMFVISSIMGNQLLSVAMAMFQPIVDYLGLALADILPKIPVLNINLIDLLAMTPAIFIQQLKDAISVPGFDFSVFPFVIDPFSLNTSIPSIEVVQIFQNLTSSYLSSLMFILEGLIGQVTSALEIASMPVLPLMPSFDTIMGNVLSLAGAGDLAEAYQKLSSGEITMQSIFSLSFPGFPIPFAIPAVLMPDISCIEIEFREMFNNLIATLGSGMMKLVMDFIDSLLGQFLSFTFPLLCFTL